jgi:hypothetical protein
LANASARKAFVGQRAQEPDGVADVVSAMEDELGKIRRREDEACQLWEGKKTKGRGFVSGEKESWGGECLEDDARVA